MIEPGDDLVKEPFARLIERGDLLAYRYKGFWEAMDTIKDKQRLDACSSREALPGSDARPAPERMLAFPFEAATPRIERVLAVGSHADDLEIGCGGTLLRSRSLVRGCT